MDRTTNSQRSRSRLQFSLRTLLVSVVLASLPMAWVGTLLHRARVQRQTVIELQKLGAACFFESQMAAANSLPATRVPPKTTTSHSLAWLDKLLGVQLSAKVVSVEFYPWEITQEETDRLAAMGRDRVFYWLGGLSAVRNRERRSGEEKHEGWFPPLIEPEPYDSPIESNTIRYGDDEIPLLIGLPDLETLNLSHTYITDACLPHLASLSKLTELRLQSTDVGDAGMVHLSKLKQLRALNLSYTRVTDAGLEPLRQLENLEELSIMGTEIGDAGLVHISSLKNLHVLVLSDTWITNKGLSHLLPLTKLEHLNINGTRVTGFGVEELQKRLPNCNVTR